MPDRIMKTKNNKWSNSLDITKYIDFESVYNECNDISAEKYSEKEEYRRDWNFYVEEWL